MYDLSALISPPRRKQSEADQIATLARMIDVLQRGYVCMQVRNRDGSLDRLPNGKPNRWWFKNAATTAGLNHMLGVTFNNVSAIGAWYFGLIDGATFSTVSANDVMNSHAGWTENQNYSGNRPQWTIGTITGGQAPTGTAATFAMTATTTIQGIFVTSSNTKGGTTGTMWATAVEGTPRNVSNGQSLQVFYTNTLTPVS